MTELFLSEDVYNEIAASILLAFTKDLYLAGDFLALRRCDYVKKGLSLDGLLEGLERFLVKLALVIGHDEEVLKKFFLDLAYKAEPKTPEEIRKELVALKATWKRA